MGMRSIEVTNSKWLMDLRMAKSFGGLGCLCHLISFSAEAKSPLVNACLPDAEPGTCELSGSSCHPPFLHMHFGFCRAGVEWWLGQVPNRHIVNWTRLSNSAQTNIVLEIDSMTEHFLYPCTMHITG